MSNNTRKPIVLSVKDKNLDPAQNTQFLTASFDVADLKDVFTNKNYSAIRWRGSRTNSNFDYATGFIPDFDHNLTIQDAEARLKRANLNYALITSKSHTTSDHRFHIFIPFKRVVRTKQDYRRIVREIRDKHFPELDRAAMDAARYLFGSPLNATYSDNWSGVDYDPDTALGKEILDAWNDTLTVTTSDGKMINVNFLKEKAPILCPFHDDQSHSAFVTKSNTGNQYFIHCASCQRTYWKVEAPMEERCERFWSHGKDVLEFGIVDDAFYMSSVGKDKFEIFIKAAKKEDKLNAYAYLLDNKHIPHLKFVNHVGNTEVVKSGFEVDREKGIVTVHYAATPARIQDNDFIETYLESTFGQYKEFIKQWLAVYCYTNYRDLPTLILKGERGSGKNTFAEMVHSIFPTISQMWEAKKGNFTSEVEMKLLIADETVCDDPEQYKLLKQYAGSKYARVNKKYKPEYEVPNNMNIIILSNSAIPIYVATAEKPTSEELNQFFVYDFKKLQGAIDPEMDQKLEDRIGHYVRTELKTVFNGINFAGNRYSIKVPITPEEAGLFISNETEEEGVAQKVIDKIIKKLDEGGEYQQFLANGYLPRLLVEDSASATKMGVTKVIKTLREQGYLEMKESEKKQFEKNRFRCYKTTEKLKKAIEEDEKAAKKAA